MIRVYVSSVINAPIEQVWAYLRDFGTLHKWFPTVTDCHIEGDGRSDQVGCIRNFGLEGGPRMREQLLALSDQNHSWTYKMVEGPVPISNYVPTFRLMPVTDGNVTFAEGRCASIAPKSRRARCLRSLRTLTRQLSTM